MRGPIEAAIGRLGLEGRVRIAGWMGDRGVRDEILKARALVLPSFAEGLPVVIMEAFALGRPVISTYIAGIPELVEPGACGWLVPAGSVDALARAMREALPAPSRSWSGWAGKGPGASPSGTTPGSRLASWPPCSRPRPSGTCPASA